MIAMRKLAPALVSVALAAGADEPYGEDDVCRVLGQTPIPKLQPRDRAFLSDRCFCYRDGCVSERSAKGEALRTRVLKDAETGKLDQAFVALMTGPVGRELDAIPRSVDRRRRCRELVQDRVADPEKYCRYLNVWFVRVAETDAVMAACRSLRACIDDPKATRCEREAAHYAEVCVGLEDFYLCRDKTQPCQ